MSWCSSSTVIGHLLLQGPPNRTQSCRASPHGAHPDGGVPTPIPPLEAPRAEGSSVCCGRTRTDRQAGGRSCGERGNKPLGAPLG
jgi:hypothetical protein